jgi:hypothetical protein
MTTLEKKRLIILLAGAVMMLAVYFCAYYACVSIQFRPYSHQWNIEEAYAHYKAGPLSEEFARRLFEPARFCDAFYLRSHLWEDRQRTPVK